MSLDAESQALSSGLSRTGPPLDLGGCQRGSRLEDLRRVCTPADRGCGDDQREALAVEARAQCPYGGRGELGQGGISFRFGLTLPASSAGCEVPLHSPSTLSLIVGFWGQS